MRSFIYCLFFLLPFFGRTQQDTIFVNKWKMADSLYGELGTLVPSGFLLNRTLMDTTASFVANAHRTTEYTANADYFYRLMHEMKLMALDSSEVLGLLELYYSASTYVGGQIFEEDRYIYPIGIADYQYQRLDEMYASQNGLIIKNGLSWKDADTLNASAYSTHKVQLTAPLFDNYSSESMGLVFKQNHFFSNHKTINDVKTLEIFNAGSWSIVDFDEVFNFIPDYKEKQYLKLRITYNNGEQFLNDIEINTPELLVKSIEPKTAFACDFGENRISEYDGPNLLEACYIPSCSNQERTTPYKAKNYIMVTGYRPPIFIQTFNKTWKLYNSEHDWLLSSIISFNYDIYLVRFNMYNSPQTHGIQEAADLLIKLLERINSEKNDKYAENVIQANSMGMDIANLALLRMEKKHFDDNSYDHHHSRLLISYDANLYGANIPLAYQYQIYSGFLQPAVSSFPFSGAPSVISTFFEVYLFASMEQKAVKELLMYHANASNDFINNHSHLQIEPTHHSKRQNLLDAFDAVDNGNHFIPIPNSTRNIAISLGKISGVNSLSNTDDVKFKNGGEYWLDFTASPYISKIRASVYSNEYTTLFRRKKVGINFFPLSLDVDHNVEVKYMQEIDNAAGSYLQGVGNIIAVTSHTYVDATTPFPLNIAKYHFSHKPVLTALGINKNLWPADGSMTLNMQSLGLMYNVKNFHPVDDLSDYYGYPNLGRPNDHFNVTPFEAIYVDHNIDPHIVLEDSPLEDKVALNSFIFNEVEPWYLGLQNQELGSQARSNYTYRSRRMARNGIITGHNVTPTTDPGDYTVNPNADLILEAGEYIDLLVGTTFLEGSRGTMVIHYQTCSGGREQNTNEGANSQDNTNFNDNSSEKTVWNLENKTDFNLFPNPTTSTFTLSVENENTIESFSIHNFSGNLLLEEENINTQRKTVNIRLDKGTYIVKVQINGEIIHKKLMVL